MTGADRGWADPPSVVILMTCDHWHAGDAASFALWMERRRTHEDVRCHIGGSSHESRVRWIFFGQQEIGALVMMRRP